MQVDESAWKVADFAWGIIMALLGLVWKSHSDRITGIEAVMNARISKVDLDTTSELALQRNHIAKLFDKLEEHSAKSQDRHVELLTAIHTGLASKKDKND